MKILIVSDTHRHNKNLETVLKKVSPIDCLIHLEMWREARITYGRLPGVPVTL